MKNVKIVIEGRAKVRQEFPRQHQRVIRPAKGGGYRRSNRNRQED